MSIRKLAILVDGMKNFNGLTSQQKSSVFFVRRFSEARYFALGSNIATQTALVTMAKLFSQPNVAVGDRGFESQQRKQSGKNQTRADRFHFFSCQRTIFFGTVTLQNFFGNVFVFVASARNFSDF